MILPLFESLSRLHVGRGGGSFAEKHTSPYPQNISHKIIPPELGFRRTFDHMKPNAIIFIGSLLVLIAAMLWYFDII